MTQVLNLLKRSLSRLVPYAVVGMGIVAAFVAGLHDQNNSDVLNLWIILVGFLVLLVLMNTYLIYVMKRKQHEAHRHHASDNKFPVATDKHSEDIKLKLEKNLLQAQKLQAIGTLAGGIAHDFNNIIYAIIGYVEMAREDASNDSLIYQNLTKALEASNHGKELISRIMSFSRSQKQPSYLTLCMQEAIENALALLKPAIPSSVVIDYRPLDKPCLIKGDATQLHQAIVNIVNNAVDAMDGEGTITIKISENTMENYYTIEVSDTGNGMESATMERIFEPFFTTKEVGKGTGLGLSTVHTIITDHQGKISVNSQLGKGTTFYLSLPEYKEK